MPLERRTFLAGAGAVAFGAVFPALGYGRSRGSYRSYSRSRGAILPWSQVRPDVRVTTTDTPGGNVLLATDGGDGALVVDTKFAYLGPAIQHDAMGYGGEADITVVNTHHHGDHTGGNAGFAGVNALSYGHEKLVPRVEAQLERYRDQAKAAPAQAGRFEQALDKDALIDLAGEVLDGADDLAARSYRPTRTVGDDGLSIRIGAVRAKLHHFGAGHTDNDLVVHLYDRNVIHTGDLVFNGYHPFFDQTAGVTAFGWLKSLRGISELCDQETVVIPGHGPVGDATLITKQIAYHEALIDAVRKERAKGGSRETVSAMQFAFFEGLGFEQIAARAIAAVYDELAATEG